jgi:hypothetical protein
MVRTPEMGCSRRRARPAVRAAGRPGGRAAGRPGGRAADPNWVGGRPRRISDHDETYIVATAAERPKKLISDELH